MINPVKSNLSSYSRVTKTTHSFFSKTFFSATFFSEGKSKHDHSLIVPKKATPQDE